MIRVKKIAMTMNNKNGYWLMTGRANELFPWLIALFAFMDVIK